MGNLYLIMLPLHVFTLVRNGMPFLPYTFYMLNSLDLDWHWHVVEGQSDNVKCTRWCRKMAPGLSDDGTTEFLDLIAKHPRVTIQRKPLWSGKLEMCNAALSQIGQPCVLMEMDADELWKPKDIHSVVKFGSDMDNFVMRFPCRYFVGQNIITTPVGSYGHYLDEWKRCWKFVPGASFTSHEPPRLSSELNAQSISKTTAMERGLMFDHYSWVYEQHVAYKCEFYGYGQRGLDGWKRLQENKLWPTKLKPFLHWVDDRAMADLLS